VTGGELQVPVSASAVLEDGNSIVFNWDRGDFSEADADDQAMLLVYSPKTIEDEESVVHKLTGAFRKEGMDTLPVQVERYDQEFHVYLGFVNAQRTQQSNSQYLGSILIPGMEQEELFKFRTASREPKANIKEPSKLTIEDRTLDIARNLRNMGLTDADIAVATGLSLEVISKIEI
jgi:hypothetical protein